MEYPPYHYLPKVYDEVIDLTFYDKMIPYLWRIIKKFDIKGHRIIDLGCGMGKFGMEFSQKGYQVTGIDISPAMIEIAKKKKDKNTEFFNMDILDIDFREKFDIACSFYNSLNYFTKGSFLSKAFQNVWKALKWGGFFIFDMNSITGLRNIVSKTSFFKVIEGGFIIAEGSWISEKMLSMLDIYFLVSVKDDEYRLIQEKHQEKGYFVKNIQSMLKNEGFINTQ
ncbi:class I SAM-dependent methyltransferase, partial [bacterium]|nr:class I SAM-dependent methyltransferase [bacterium]